MFLIFLLYAFLALTFTIGKMLLFYVPPIFLIAVRMIIAGTVLLTIHYFMSGPIKMKSVMKDWWLFIWLSLIHIFIPYTSEFIALQYVAPACAALMFNLSPFFSALFSYLYFGEKMTKKKWLGFAIGIIGIVLFLEPSAFNIACWHVSSIAYLLLMISVICGALGWIYVRMLVKNKGYSPLYINGVAMLLAGIQAIPVSLYFEGNVHVPSDQLKSFLLLLAAIIILANGIFYNLYGYLLKHYSATLLSFIGFLTPVFAALFDWMLLGIGVSYGFFIAIAILAVGIYIFYQEELRQGYVS
ncbi:MAG TPA: DMT family transporter [Candidatus Saccharimonadales bacterium]|nr:DMT family transporter [Candidatus Saccharimonadales bacterium]